MTGSIRGVSFYSMRGSDKTIMRTKGGASKNKIKTSPKFEGLRNHQKEWAGCTSFGSTARYALGGLHRLADYNLTPVLNGMAKNLMKLDTESEVGMRRLNLSAFPQALENFNFNRKNPFNSVLRVTVPCRIDREKLCAVVEIPRINALNDIYNYQQLPYFRIIVAMGLLSDMERDDTHSIYKACVPNLHGYSIVQTGAWHPSQSILQPELMRIEFDEKDCVYVNERVTILLSMGIEFGKVGFTGEPEAMKYAGSAKVIAVG